MKGTFKYIAATIVLFVTFFVAKAILIDAVSAPNLFAAIIALLCAGAVVD